MHPLQTPPQSPKSQKRANPFTRDQRLQVKILAKEGFSCRRIAEILEITHKQVRYTMKTNQLTLKKSRGQGPILSDMQVNEVEAFITSSQEGRQISYFEVAHSAFPHLNVSEKVIRREMLKRGYTRQIAAAKPLLSRENVRKRYEFARNYIHWEKEDWMRVLWSGES